jgi:hypothetical protein
MKKFLPIIFMFLVLQCFGQTPKVPQGTFDPLTKPAAKIVLKNISDYVSSYPDSVQVGWYNKMNDLVVFMRSDSKQPLTGFSVDKKVFDYVETRIFGPSLDGFQSPNDVNYKRLLDQKEANERELAEYECKKEMCNKIMLRRKKDNPPKN